MLVLLLLVWKVWVQIKHGHLGMDLDQLRAQVPLEKHAMMIKHTITAFIVTVGLRVVTIVGGLHVKIL